MRLKNISRALLVTFAALAFTNIASAKSVTMTFEYQYQAYYISINGSSTFTPLMCDSYDNRVYRGETWTATASPFLQGVAGSLFGPTMTLDYKAAGLIYKSMMKGTITTLQAQWAVWGLFSANARANSMFTTFGGAATDATYLAEVGTASNSAYNGLILYTPTGAKAGFGPQEYIGYNPVVPEPGSIVLFGTGLLGIAGVIRRNMIRRKLGRA